MVRLGRPILAVTPLASEAEALAGEAGLFLDDPVEADSPERRVHLLRGWETAPLAQLSPSLDNQAAQFEALFSMRRLGAPLVITSADALMMRTMPRERFERSVIKLTMGDRLDLESLIEELSGIGYQRVPQTEELGDFSVRGGIVDVFLANSSPAAQARVRRRRAEFDSPLRIRQSALAG